MALCIFRYSFGGVWAFPPTFLDYFSAKLAMSPKRTTLVIAVLVSCHLGSVAGCGSSTPVPTGSVREARGVLRVLGIEYANFAAQHNDRPPADKAELVAFLESRRDHIAGLQAVEQLFVSPRDNQPLLIYYGKSMPPPDESGFPAVARELTGADGKCLVANTRGGVMEIASDQVPAHLAASD